MKTIVINCIFFMLAIASHAQVILKEPLSKTAQPVNTKTISNAAPVGSPPIQVTDLKITIDRIDDISNFEENNYRVNYTVSNAGSEPIDLSKYYRGGIKGAFVSNGNALPFLGGGANLYANGKAILQPGESITGIIELLKQQLTTGATYKYTLTVDNDNRIEEANENNNTVESNITARAIKNGDYFLTTAKITVQTGNDNKEANNSLAYFYIGVANRNASVAFSVGDVADKSGYAPEIAVNSTTELLPNRRMEPGLHGGLHSPYNTLCFFKQRGLAVTVIYENKAWATDAWKINSISVTIEFKDKNGNPYPNPAYASKTINFPVAGLLGYRSGDDITNNSNQLRMLTMGTDENFNPLPVEFHKYSINSMILKVNNSPLKNAPIIYCQ